MKHEPYNKVKGKMREKGMTVQDVADALGLSRVSVSDKINGKSDFLITEAVAVARLLTSDLHIFLP